MSEDLTQRLPKSVSENAILTAVQNLDSHVRSSIDNLVTWVSSIDARLKSLEQKVSSIDGRLKNLEQKVEQRLYDTRPIWHKVVADIAQLQEGQQRLEAGQEALRKDVRDLTVAVQELKGNRQNSST